MSFEGVPGGLECFEQLMVRDGKACDKKADNDLNYVGLKTIHIDISFTRSQESKHMKILGTEM